MFGTLSCFFNGSGTVAAQKKYHRQVPKTYGNLDEPGTSDLSEMFCKNTKNDFNTGPGTREIHDS